MQKSTVITLIVLIAILAVASIAVLFVSNSDERTYEGSAAQVTLSDQNQAASSFTTLGGERAELDQYLGDVIIAHAWASWVPTSQASLQRLATAQAMYADQNVTILAINRGEPASIARAYLREVEINNLQLVLDNEDVYFDRVAGVTMPETIFYNAAGDVVFHKRGELTRAELHYWIEQAVSS